MSGLQPWNDADIRVRPRRKRRSAPTKTSPVAAVTVTYRGAPREVLYQPGAPLVVLLATAIRAHGMRFATHGHLRLHDQADTEIPLGSTAGKTRIRPGAQLTLRRPDTGA